MPFRYGPNEDEMTDAQALIRLCGWLAFYAICAIIVIILHSKSNVDVDSSVSGSEPSTSLDYQGLHPVCRDAIIGYSMTAPDTVAWMCNMTGDIWVTDQMRTKP